MEIEESLRNRVEALLDARQKTLGDSLGITFTKLTRDEVVATMPVDHRTVQPVRILHGGASVALAESVMSVGALLQLSPDSNQTVVGLEIHANHIRSVPEGGQVTATARPRHRGRRTQVWETELQDNEGNTICLSRLTLMNVDLPV
ncbi:MAG: hotdog fold thioesterase [Balneolaceae bacterium]